MRMLNRVACLATAGAAAVAFFPGPAVAAPTAGDISAAAVAERFVGEGRGDLEEAKEQAERDAYRKARRAGYSADECEDERIHTQPNGGTWTVRHTIGCESDGDDDDNGGNFRERLVNVASDLCFDASGRNPRVEECDGTREQAVNYERLELQVLGRCVGQDDNRVVLVRCDGSNANRWDRLNSNDRTILLENRESGDCLAVLGRVEEGSRVGVRECDNTDAQEWRLRG